jgi:hypothetical protein
MRHQPGLGEHLQRPLFLGLPLMVGWPQKYRNDAVAACLRTNLATVTVNEQRLRLRIDNRPQVLRRRLRIGHVGTAVQLIAVGN